MYSPGDKKITLEGVATTLLFFTLAVALIVILIGTFSILFGPQSKNVKNYGVFQNDKFIGYTYSDFVDNGCIKYYDANGKRMGTVCGNFVVKANE